MSIINSIEFFPDDQEVAIRDNGKSTNIILSNSMFRELVRKLKIRRKHTKLTKFILIEDEFTYELVYLGGCGHSSLGRNYELTCKYRGELVNSINIHSSFLNLIPINHFQHQRPTKYAIKIQTHSAHQNI